MRSSKQSKELREKQAMLYRLNIAKKITNYKLVLKESRNYV